jgi:DNA-binding CsgD family transcriptional regulator
MLDPSQYLKVSCLFLLGTPSLLFHVKATYRKLICSNRYQSLAWEEWKGVGYC